MSDDDMEDYGFEYSEEEQEEEDVDIENQYYNSKGLLESEDPTEAIEGFDQVVKMEEEKGEWHKMYDEMMKAYKKMLEYIDSAVTRNASEKKINSLLDFMGQATDINVLQDFYEQTLKDFYEQTLKDFYEQTLKALERAKNERLWFKTNLKLTNLWSKKQEYGRMNRILKDLHRSCQREDGSDDPKKGTQLLEIYAIEIQM
eukprot:gene21234-28150_t